MATAYTLPYVPLPSFSRITKSSNDNRFCLADLARAVPLPLISVITTDLCSVPFLAFVVFYEASVYLLKVFLRDASL